MDATEWFSRDPWGTLMIDEMTMKRAAAVGLPAGEANPGPPIHAFPLRTEWDALQPIYKEPWPKPDMVNVDATQDSASWPRSVRSMVTKANTQGWSVLVTKAKGSWPTTGKKPSRARYSFAVRMSRGEDRAVAVYVEGVSEKATWSWDTLYRWTSGQRATKFENITAFDAVA